MQEFDNDLNHPFGRNPRETHWGTSRYCQEGGSAFPVCLPRLYGRQEWVSIRGVSELLQLIHEIVIDGLQGEGEANSGPCE